MFYQPHTSLEAHHNCPREGHSSGRPGSSDHGPSQALPSPPSAQARPIGISPSSARPVSVADGLLQSFL